MAGSSRIDELRKKFDENPRRYFAPLANEYRKLGDFDQAIFICQEFLPQQPGHMSGHIVYGQALFEGGRHEEARTVFETALTLDPENLIALRHLGDIARAFGDLVSARGWYQRVLDADPRNEEIADILQSLGGEAPSIESLAARDTADAATTASAEAQSGSSALEEAHVEPPALSAPPKSSVSDFAALIEEVRAEAAGESARAREAPAPSPAASAHATPAIDGLQGAFTETPAAPPPGAKDESDLDALFDLASAPGDAIVEKTSDPTSGLRGSAPSAEPLGDLVTDGVAAASSAAAAAGAFVTETMAELYLRQGHRDEALGVYRQLVESRPGDEALRARLSVLEAESTAVVSSTDEAPAATDSPSRPSGRSIREFLGDIAARRPRTNGSSASDVTEQPSSTAGNELPFLTDLPESATASASASPEPTSPSLPDLSAEVGGLSHASVPPASRPAEATGRDSAASVAGSLGALFAEAESLGRGAGGGGSVTAESSATADSRGHGNAATRESATGEHAPLPGRPTQPAATELSLDYVFRHVTPAKSTPGQPNFSFDQFFSQESQQDAGTSGGEPAREPATDESDDIQQFNAWLEGLKKS